MDSIQAYLLAQGTYLANNIPQLLYSTTLGAPAASVTYTVTTPYNRIWVVWYARGTAAATSEDFQCQLNGVSTSSYIWQDIQGVNSTASAGTSGGATTSIAVGNVTANTATAGYYSSGSFVIDGANQSATFVTMQGTAASFLGAASSIAGTYSGQYNAVGPVTSVTLSATTGNLGTGSQFSFYGLG